MKTAGKEEKSKWYQAKAKAILDRKQAALKELAKQFGRPIKGYTMATIINHDTRTADIYKFKGFHLHIRWNAPTTQKAYVTSVKY